MNDDFDICEDRLSILEDLLEENEDWDNVTIDELEKRYHERQMEKLSEMELYGMYERDFF